jgi:hypothetical protein
LIERIGSHPESAERIFGDDDPAETVAALESLARGARALAGAFLVGSAGTAPRPPAEDYVGTYGELTVSRRGNLLVAAQRHYVPALLAPTSVADELAADDEFGTLYRFERDGGRVVAVVRDRPGFGERRFERIPPSLPVPFSPTTSLDLRLTS